jgi:hypothetical protein
MANKKIKLITNIEVVIFLWSIKNHNFFMTNKEFTQGKAHAMHECMTLAYLQQVQCK